MPDAEPNAPTEMAILGSTWSVDGSNGRTRGRISGERTGQVVAVPEGNQGVFIACSVLNLRGRTSQVALI